MRVAWRLSAIARWQSSLVADTPRVRGRVMLAASNDNAPGPASRRVEMSKSVNNNGCIFVLAFAPIFKASAADLHSEEGRDDTQLTIDLDQASNPKIDISKFSRVCGMLGSDFDGERAAAALAATRMLANSGMTWSELFESVARKTIAS